MTDKAEHKRLKAAVDVLSAIAIITLFIVPIWCIYDPNFHAHGVPGGKPPIQLKILLLDGIPVVFGVIWLSWRYGEVHARKWPFVRTSRFRLLVMAAALVFGTFVSVLLEGK
jgi:hypothetical protein